jgi:hypothetical protein
MPHLRRPDLRCPPRPYDAARNRRPQLTPPQNLCISVRAQDSGNLSEKIRPGGEIAVMIENVHRLVSRRPAHLEDAASVPEQIVAEGSGLLRSVRVTAVDAVPYLRWPRQLLRETGGRFWFIRKEGDAAVAT